MRLQKFQIINLIILTAVHVCALPLRAQVENHDSLTTIKLKEVVVEAQHQKVSATVSTYIPTSKQKNASQSGIDLLNRMAIPQLALGTGTSINTVGNQHVDVFIDGIPASTDDLKNIRTTDVKKVEYYDYPADPRFLGNAHVVNFVMKKYEHGGYLKTFASERFITSDGQLSFFGKYQIKSFFFDIGLGTLYYKSAHDFIENTETYRLPQENGTEEVLKRTETVSAADKRNKLFWPTLRLVYNNDKITISNTIGAVFDHTPTNNLTGNVSLDNMYSASSFYKRGFSYQNSISYTGNWNFILGKGNTINFNPTYSYTHSRLSNLYKEGMTEYPNFAKDDSQVARARLQFNHSFGNTSSINVFTQGLFYRSSTVYTGTSDMHDRLYTYRIGPGLGYTFSKDKYYVYLGVGFNYDYSKYAQIVEHSTQPWADASIQYAFNDKNKLSAAFHYMTSVPLSSYRSEAVIQSNQLLSYTGNPALKPYRSYDYGITYTCIPDKKISFSAYAYAWTVCDRYAFVYKPTPTGILRAIEQPMGGFTSLTFGANGRVSLLQNKLQVSGQIAVPYCHNGDPFNSDHINVNYMLQAYWYFGAWNMGARYTSKWHSPGNAVNGLRTTSKEIYYVSIGWANSDWNVSVLIANPFTFSWEKSCSKINSTYFDQQQNIYGTDSHCYIKLGVTYVFGFGKKVKRINEVSRQEKASSAILK